MYNYNITQNQRTPSFGAALKTNPFMEAGRKRCIELAKEGSEEALERINTFVNQLNFIKNDKSMTSFTIDAYPEDLFHPLFPGFHFVRIDNKRVGNYTLEYVNSKNEGDYCMAAVDEFVKRHYGEGVAKSLEGQRNHFLEAAEKLGVESPKYYRQLMRAKRSLSGMAKSLDLEM